MTAEEWEQLEEIDQAIDRPLQSAVQFSLVINLFLGYGLKYMWKIANMLQFVIFFIHWQINISPEAEVIIKQMKKLALFEFIDRETVAALLNGDEQDQEGSSVYA